MMLNILLMCGGKSLERDISLNSVRSVYDHIKGINAFTTTVVFFDIDGKKYGIDEEYLYSNTSDDFRFLLESIAPLSDEDYLSYLAAADLVFPVIHGAGGEDGEIQRFLEKQKINFVGSPSSACKMMYNKHNADEQILKAGRMFSIPKMFVAVGDTYEASVAQFVAEIGDVVLKPVEGGSSFGVMFATSSEQAQEALKKLLEVYPEVVIEKRCDGKEFTIIILENKGVPVALMPTEIEIEGQFDTRRKYMSTTEVRYHCPARFGKESMEQIRSNAENLFRFVGAKDFLRIDGWLFEDGNIYFSDFNPISGMEQNSFIFQQSTKVGFTHGTALEYILRNACQRYGIEYPSVAQTTSVKRRVNVLLGGTTSERQVSLLSGTNVWLKLMRSEKYAPVPYVMTADNHGDYIVHEIPYSVALLHTTEEIISQINSGTLPRDLVFEIQKKLGVKQAVNDLVASWVPLREFVETSKEQGAYVFLGLHGGFGESGGIQAVLDDVGVDYNGSGSDASALCMDKYLTGEKVTALGLAQLRTCKKILGNLDVTWEYLTAELGQPIIAKPNGDGCSTGVVKLLCSEDLSAYLTCCKEGKDIPPETFNNQPQVIAMPHSCSSVLFEEYIEIDPIKVIEGTLKYSPKTGWLEITIGVLEKHGCYHAFNPSITLAENDILSVEEKFQGGVGINLTPPRSDMVSTQLRRRIQYFAERVAESCDVEDYCRIDMFVNNKTNEVIVIEINSLPGLSPSTVLFQQAAKEQPTLSPLALLERIIGSEGDFNLDRLTFKEALECTGGTTTYAGEDFLLSGVKFDSRDNVRGMAFVAFVTDRDNGHKYIPIAANKGAVAAIVSEDVVAEIPLIKVPDTRKAYQAIAKYYREKFSIPVVALTGSNGKTTVKDMLTAVLSSKYKVLATEKNLNNELGVPQTLLRLDSSYEAAVIEMGMNHSGEIRALANIVQPDVAIITMIGTAHMGNLGGTRRDVFNAKMEIVEGLKEDGTLVLCSDDDMLSGVEPDGFRVVFAGLKKGDYNVLYASDIAQSWDDAGYGLTFVVHYNNNSHSCTLPVLGQHNVQNALLALAAGVQLGISIESAIEALRIYPRSSMRLETGTVHGVKFIKDYYNASSDSTKAALDALHALKGTNASVAILGEMLELGDQCDRLHREVAEYSIGKADKVYFVGTCAATFRAARPDAFCFMTKEELNDALVSAIINGDIGFGNIVLIKGSNGMKMWEQYEFVRKLLERGHAVSTQTRLLIDVDALKHNYAAIKQAVGSGVEIMPVIKADAYGSGADLVASIYSDCKYFAVADLREADELRAIIPDKSILILNQQFMNTVDFIAERDYVASVSNIEFARALNEAAQKQGKKLRIHIEVDTGMHRFGLFVDECEEFSRQLLGCSNLVVDGIFTHYSSADMYSTEDLDFTAKQTQLFEQAIEIVEGILGAIQWKHACASAAIFNPRAKHFNMVRPGYSLRGYYPCEEMRSKVELRPALKYVTQVSQMREFECGMEVSYGRTFITGRKTRAAVIPAGYYNGISRRLSNGGAFVINGQLVPIIGNVCMNSTLVDVTDISPLVWVGDDVAIFDNINMTVERMAELCDTIGYEILTSIKDKADKIEVF